MIEINKHLRMVREFHEAFDYKQAKHMQEADVVLTDKVRFGRMSFLAEELSEILAAKASGSRVGQLDGAIDLAYFALGTLAIIGREPQTHARPPIGLQLVFLVESVCMSLRTLSFYEVKQAQADLPNALSRLYFCCIAFSELEVNADFEGGFSEVHRSNMSKLSADGKPIYNDSGKIVKGPAFSEPVLLPYLRNA